MRKAILFLLLSAGLACAADVAIVSVGLPASAVAGEHFNASITAANLENFTANATISLSFFGECPVSYEQYPSILPYSQQSFYFDAVVGCAGNYTVLAVARAVNDSNSSNGKASLPLTVYASPSNATPSPTVTPSPNASVTPSPSPSPTPSPNPTITPSPSITPSPTPSPAPTVIPSPGVFPSPSQTPSLWPEANGSVSLSFDRALGNSQVTVLAEGATSFTRVFGAGYNTSFELPKGDWAISAIVDDPATPAADYLSEAQAVRVAAGRQSNLSVALYPAGDLSGEINAAGASLKLSCAGFDGLFETRASQNGSFDFGAVPARRCTIIAASPSGEKEFNVTVRQGEENNERILLVVDVSIDRKTGGEIGNALLFVAFLLVFLCAALLLPRFKRILARHKARQEAQPSGLKASKRALDVISTLPEREAAVVNHLLDNKGRDTQSRIRKKLLIPKTSLFRIIASLEKKNVVNAVKDGKAVKVSFTDWFKSKE